MERPCQLHAAALLALAIASLPAQEDVTRPGKTFTVVLHPGKLGDEIAARLADEALAAAESARPVLEKLYQRPAKAPTIHVWASREEHQAVAQDPKWQFVKDAVCRPEKNESHVLLRPLLTDHVFAALGLPETTRNDVVHQAAMLAACDRSPLARGDQFLAEVFAAGVLEAVVFADVRDGVDPNRDGRFWFLSREAKDGKGRPLRSHCSLVDAVPREQYDYVLQGHAAVARLLASTGSGWAKKLLNVKVKDSDPVPARRTAALQAVLGTDDKRNEERFAKLLSASAAQFRVTAPLVAVRGGRILIAAGKLEWAGIGAVSSPPPVPYALRATIEIAVSGPSPGASTVMVRFDETETSAIEIECKVGRVTVGIRERATDKAESKSFDAPIEIGKPFALSVEVRKATSVTVLVDGQQIADVPVTARTMDGEWRIAKLDGFAWLDKLRCEPLDAAPKK